MYIYSSLNGQFSRHLFKIMKVKVPHLFLTLAAVFVLSFSVKAQEESPVLESPEPTTRENNFDEDKTLIYDHPSQTSVMKDSAQSAPRVVNPVAKVAKPEVHKENQKVKSEEDALSFNFLYYMIQKFKLTDLIDQ